MRSASLHCSTCSSHIATRLIDVAVASTVLYAQQHSDKYPSPSKLVLYDDDDDDDDDEGGGEFTFTTNLNRHKEIRHPMLEMHSGINDLLYVYH